METSGPEVINVPAGLNVLDIIVLYNLYLSINTPIFFNICESFAYVANTFYCHLCEWSEVQHSFGH